MPKAAVKFFKNKKVLWVLKYTSIAGAGMGVLGLLLLVGVYLFLTPNLPDIETLKEIKLTAPLRIFTEDGKSIYEFGGTKRKPVKYEDIPSDMVHAFVSAEDARFFEHGGVDPRGLLRAVIHLIKTGKKGQGGSTITMQVARNFFLSRKKTYLRKINEIFLAWKIEDKLSKEDIIELYLNKIYLGKQSYGVAAAAQIYYGKSISDLTLPQMAMIAGLPKAPSRYNPIVNPRRALLRRNYVLKRMHDLNYIDDEIYLLAKDEVDEASVYAVKFDVDAPYIAEMVRDYMVKEYGDEVYNLGFHVYTTLDTRLQKAANSALHKNIMNYDRRHGYRGAASHVEIETAWPLDDVDDLTFEIWDTALSEFKPQGHLLPGLVVGMKMEQNEDGQQVPRSAVIFQPKFNDLLFIPWQGMSWARPFINRDIVGDAPTDATQILQVGDIIYIEKMQAMDKTIWWLAQPPEVEAAIVSMDPKTGAIRALVGGFDFNSNKFNRVIQAKRQLGSNFKPFIYSAALEKCYTPATIINDSPVVIQDADGNPWRPENDDGRFRGPMRLRMALTKSVNLISIRILQGIGVGYAIDYATQFGFEKSQLPRNLTLSLGTASVTPLAVARGYSVFANGGYIIEPYFISKVTEPKGAPVFIAPKIELQVDPPDEKNPADGQDHLLAMDDEINTPADLINSDLPEYKLELVEEPNESDSDQSQAEESKQLDEITQETAIAERVISKRNVFLMTSIMRDVIKYGTGQRAMQLNRNDLAGKTGTTNNLVDAWFSGFNDRVVTTAWVGFDQPQTLGRGEYGGRAALPMWIAYMAQALRGMPETVVIQPPGVVNRRIDPQSGEFASVNTEQAIFEYFDEQCLEKVEQDGQQQNQTTPGQGSGTGTDQDAAPTEIF